MSAAFSYNGAPLTVFSIYPAGIWASPVSRALAFAALYTSASKVTGFTMAVATVWEFTALGVTEVLVIGASYIHELSTVDG
jgi:hypothetical protein